ncbi:MAG: TOBE domain-containing protein, partial [Rhizobiales bacterium]|nr:TOBE domain-containing protein [Rhizobacter sp.]
RTTTVYVTHDQIEAMTLGDRIVVMRDGQVEQCGTPDDIYARPASRFVAEFIGSPAMNMITAARTGDSLHVQGTALALDAVQRASVERHIGDEVIYGLRPEALTLSSDGLPGRLRLLEPTGPETYAFVDTPIGSLVARVQGPVRHKVGDPINLAWASSHAHLFDASTQLRLTA